MGGDWRAPSATIYIYIYIYIYSQLLSYIYIERESLEGCGGARARRPPARNFGLGGGGVRARARLSLTRVRPSPPAGAGEGRRCFPRSNKQRPPRPTQPFPFPCRRGLESKWRGLGARINLTTRSGQKWPLPRDAVGCPSLREPQVVVKIGFVLTTNSGQKGLLKRIPEAGGRGRWGCAGRAV